MSAAAASQEALAKKLGSVEALAFLKETEGLGDTFRADLEAMKGHFSKLKFKFIELETKHLFLKDLWRADGNYETRLGLTDVKALEAQSSDTKASLKAAKAVNARQAAEISAQLMRHQDAFRAHLDAQQHMASIQNEVAKLQIEIQDLSIGFSHSYLFDNQVIGVEQGREILKRQHTQLIDLTEHRQALDQKIAKQKLQIEAVSEEISAFERSIKALDESIQFIHGSNHLQRSEKIIEMNNWYRNVNQYICKLGLMEARVKRNIIKINMHAKLPDHDTVLYELILEIDPVSMRPKQYRLSPGDIDLALLDQHDHLSEGIVEMISELKHLLTRHVNVTSQLEVIKNEYEVLYEPNFGILAIFLNSQYYVTFKLCDADIQRPYSITPFMLDSAPDYMKRAFTVVLESTNTQSTPKKPHPDAEQIYTHVSNIPESDYMLDILCEAIRNYKV